MTYDYSIVGSGNTHHDEGLNQPRQRSGGPTSPSANWHNLNKENSDFMDNSPSVPAHDSRTAAMQSDSVSSNDIGMDRLARLGGQIERLAEHFSGRIQRLEARADLEAAVAEAESRLTAAMEARIGALKADLGDALSKDMHTRLADAEARMRQRINAALAAGGRRLAELRASHDERFEPAESAIADLRRRIEAIEARRRPASAEGLSGEADGPGDTEALNFGPSDNPIRTPPALAVIEGGRVRAPAPAETPPPALAETPGPLDDEAPCPAAPTAPEAAADDAPPGVTPDEPAPAFDPSRRRETDVTGRTLLALVVAGGVLFASGAAVALEAARDASARWLVARHDAPEPYADRDL